jgi:peptidyl-prolyl cis-trans isomerase D
MLQKLREKTSGWVAFVILGAVSIPFAFFGINNYFERRVENFVARVGEQDITPDAFRQSFEQYRQSIRQQFGEAYDASMFESPLIKRQYLEQMIDRELLMQAANQHGLGASDALLREEIQAISAFHVNGQFSTDQYKLLLNSRSMSEVGFEQQMREDLSAQELTKSLQNSGLVTDTEIDTYLRLRDQTRDFRYVSLPASTPVTVEPAAADIESYYALHQSEFMSEEQVSLEYVDIDAASLSVNTNPDEATLKARYEEQKARFTEPERRLASHVLIKLDPNADAAAQKTALDRATALLAEIRAGKPFADVAKASSDDLGSQGNGGDLGWVKKGDMDAAFETALFALKAGDLSEPVKSAEGYHVIQLREVQAESVRTFEQVRDELAAEFATTERETVFSKISGDLYEKVIDDPQSLGEAAQAAGLAMGHTPPFGRSGGEGIAADPRVIKAAFSEAVLNDGEASTPIELSPNHVVIVRVDEHKPSAVRALEEVRTEVIARLNAETTAKQAEDAAKALEARLLGGESLDAIAQSLQLTPTVAEGVGRNAASHDAAVVAEAFKVARPTEGTSGKALAKLPNGYALVEVSKVVDGDVSKTDAAGRDSVRQVLQQAAAESERRALIESLRASIKVEVAEDRL